MLVQLTPIETINKELQCCLYGFRSARKTTRATCQSGQIMAQLSVTDFDRVGVGFAPRDFIGTQVIPQAIIDIKGIVVIALSLGCLIHHLLDRFVAHLVRIVPGFGIGGVLDLAESVPFVNTTRWWVP